MLFEALPLMTEKQTSQQERKVNTNILLPTSPAGSLGAIEACQLAINRISRTEGLRVDTWQLRGHRTNHICGPCCFLSC